jgi:chromosome segregation ATPase
VGKLEEHERRITAIEERLVLEAGLRAGGDRDLGDMAQALRAQQHAIQALAITQSQHNEKLDRQEEQLDRHEKSLTAAHGKLDRIITTLDHLVGDGGR